MFAAIFIRGARTAPQELASGEALLEALFPFKQPDVSGVWSDARGLIAQGVIHNTPESVHERSPEVCAETGRVIASWVRLDNREALCAQIGIDHRPGLTDPQIILAAHRKWGRDCAKKLEGDFSFVIHDPASGETYCARDAIGTKPFYYVLTDELFIAATSIAAIKVIKGLSLTPSLKWIALLAAAMTFAHEQGAYEEVRKLPAAHDWVVARDHASEPREYFAFDLAAPLSTRRDDKWVAEYRDLFDQAVADRARSGFLVGADSSGGLDSSSIVASLIKVLPHDLSDFHTFSMIAMEREPELVDAVSAMHGLPNTHRLIQPELLRMDAGPERALKAMGHPPEQGQLLLHPEFFPQFEQLGIRTILSGYGGDEVVTSYANYLIDELHARGEWRAVLGQTYGSPLRRAGRFAKRLWRGAEDPDNRARAMMKSKLEIACLSREFLEDSGLGAEIEAWFLPNREELSLNAIAANEPGFRLARTARLESSAIFAATYGVEYRFPMYDRRLMQQFFATPSIEKRHQDMGRYLHRRAMEGRIPPQIQWQKSKYVGEFIGGKPTMTQMYEAAFEELPEAVQTVIDRAALEETLSVERGNRDETSHNSMRRRFTLWQIQQLEAWLRTE